MRLYELTSTRDGKPWVFHRDSTHEQSMRELTAFFAKYGIEIRAKYIGFESDRPLFRWATEEELAAGSERIVKNT